MLAISHIRIKLLTHVNNSFNISFCYKGIFYQRTGEWMSLAIFVMLNINHR